MKIFIDFDDTLIDRTRFMRDFYAMFDGVSSESLKETYDRFRTHQAFDLKNFAAEVELMHGIPERDVIAKLTALRDRVHAYRFEESRPFLEQLKQRGHTITLVTFAEDTTWQWGKIHASGLYDLLDDVHITTRGKEEVLRELTNGEPFCFIDDSGKEVEAVQKMYPHALCFLKVHDNGKADGFTDSLTSFRSFHEIIDRIA